MIEFLTSAAAERCLFAVGGFPATRASAYARGNWLPPDPISNQPLCGKKAGASVNIGPEIKAALGTAIQRPTTRYYTDFTTLLQHQVWNMLSQASQGDETGSGVGRHRGEQPGRGPARGRCRERSLNAVCAWLGCTVDEGPDVDRLDVAGTLDLRCGGQGGGHRSRACGRTASELGSWSWHHPSFG